MPYMKDGKRDYRREYDKYQGRPSIIKRRVLRNKARAILAKLGRVHKGDGKDVDHIRALDKGGSNAKTNWRVVSAAKNRSFKRTRTGSVA